jgi:hypothetical protein
MRRDIEEYNGTDAVGGYQDRTFTTLLNRPPPHHKQIQIILIYTPRTTDPDTAKRAGPDALADGLRRKPKLAGCFADTQEIHPTLTSCGPGFVPNLSLTFAALRAC